MTRILVAAALMMGCATSPEIARCPTVNMTAVYDNGEMYFIIDQDNMAMLVLMQHGLQNGTCRIPKGESV